MFHVHVCLDSEYHTVCICLSKKYCSKYFGWLVQNKGNQFLLKCITFRYLFVSSHSFVESLKCKISIPKTPTLVAWLILNITHPQLVGFWWLNTFFRMLKRSLKFGFSRNLHVLLRALKSSCWRSDNVFFKVSKLSLFSMEWGDGGSWYQHGKLLEGTWWSTRVA